MFYQINISPKAYRLEISEPGLRFVVILYITTVGSQTGARIPRLGLATETKSDRSEFIVRPLSCKTEQKKECMEVDTNSCRSEFVPVSREHPLTLCISYNFVRFGMVNRVSNGDALHSKI